MSITLLRNMESLICSEKHYGNEHMPLSISLIQTIERVWKKLPLNDSSACLQLKIAPDQVLDFVIEALTELLKHVNAYELEWSGNQNSVFGANKL